MSQNAVTFSTFCMKNKNSDKGFKLCRMLEITIVNEITPLTVAFKNI